MIFFSKVYFSVILICMNFHHLYGIKCDDVKNTDGGAGSMSAETLSSMSASEVDTCLVELGKDRLQPDQGKILWSLFLKNYDSISDIPVEKLRTVGWVSIGISVSDIRNLTFDDSDIIQAFGIYHALNAEQLSALAEQYFEYTNKTPEDITYYDLIFLRQIICAFNKTDIEHIHPEEYKEAAGILGTLKDCPIEVLQGLANLAIHDDAFGPPSEWSMGEVKLIGAVVQGLSNEQRRLLPQEAQQFKQTQQNNPTQ
ncbi:uncharacterized protein LOC123295877 [Chrysoperla carnea]|uniref:uncharacterized protein LOC123295877 n=1 Tax=Chrysoperla carnea TaxID=189513 RepID=UPI001D07B2A1|nr:uncharacterized protein LOC123295877 [Chrysoperla carnea]